MLYSSSFDPFRDPRMFGPLLFTVCFGSDSYFRSLELSLKSIATYGAFDGPYLILTDRDGLAPARSAARALPAARVIDIDRPNPATRFLIAHTIGTCDRPTLYLDVDIVVTAPLEPILRRFVDDETHLLLLNRRFLPDLARSAGLQHA